MRTRSLAGSLFTATVAVLGLSALLAVSAGAQVNGARLAIGPTMPTSTTVGRLIIPPDSITFTPSCGSLPGGAVPPCPNPDPGVFSVSPTGTGRAGTNCAGQAYSISQTSPATGEMRLIGAVITLNASDPTTRVGGTCIIDMTVDIMKAPSIDGDPL